MTMCASFLFGRVLPEYAWRQAPWLCSALSFVARALPAPHALCAGKVL